MTAYRVALVVGNGTYQITVHDEAGLPVGRSVVLSNRELVALVARGGTLQVWCDTRDELAAERDTDPADDPLPSPGDQPL